MVRGRLEGKGKHMPVARAHIYKRTKVRRTAPPKTRRWHLHHALVLVSIAAALHVLTAHNDIFGAHAESLDSFEAREGTG